MGEGKRSECASDDGRMMLCCHKETGSEETNKRERTVICRRESWSQKKSRLSFSPRIMHSSIVVADARERKRRPTSSRPQTTGHETEQENTCWQASHDKEERSRVATQESGRAKETEREVGATKVAALTNRESESR